MPLTSGTCAPWATTADLSGGPCASYSFDPAILDGALQLASDVLYDLTGRKWAGECEDVIRPPSECGCSRVRDVCGCGWVSAYRLPGWPVVAVDQVLVDGEVIDPARYRIDNHAELVYVRDPDNPGEPISGWPVWQDASLPATERGTWQVSYTFGAVPPEGGVTAAAALGCQIALAITGSQDCVLPPNTRSIVRQELSIDVLDPTSLFKEGLTNVPVVDLWVQSVLLGDRRKPARILVPGMGRARRDTT